MSKKERLKQNVRSLPKMLSAWFMVVTGGLVTWWIGLPETQQLSFLRSLPISLPPEAYPSILTLIGLALRVWPQASVEPPPESPGTNEAQPKEGDPQ